MVYAVILAGGRGERFWPLSRLDRPKQFLRLTSDKMMLEDTIDRVLPLVPRDRMRIVTGEKMSTLIRENISDLTDQNLLTEPIARNTAPAVGLAAVHLLHEDDEAVMLVLSADHLVRPPERLLSILKTAAAVAADEDVLITIGIVPTRPETGYGYIKLGELYRQEAGFPIHQVSAFTEKPKAVVASEYYYSNEYLWNAGMFVWSAQSVLQAIRVCQPELGNQLDQYRNSIGTPEEPRARASFYEQTTGISIDFAVLEKAANVMTIKADIVWDDVGDWRALERYRQIDGDNNVVVGEAVMVDTYETTVVNESDGIVACLGISDLVVVRADNITLVAHKSKAQEIRKLLAILGEDERTRQYL